MIHGTSVFSMADLYGSNGHLYGKYKKRNEVFDVECIEENPDEGTTYVRIKQSNTYDHIKTSKIYDIFHSNENLW
jgi:hypothetical protein